MGTRLRRGGIGFRPLPACRQEREFGTAGNGSTRFSPACRLSAESRKFWQLETVSTAVFAPCRLVRQERKFWQLERFDPRFSPPAGLSGRA